MSLMRGAFLFALLFSFHLSFAQVRIEESYRVVDPSGTAIQKIKNRFQSDSTLIVDHVLSDGFEVYGPRGLGEWLSTEGMIFFSDEVLFEIKKDYPSYEEITQRLQGWAQQYPQLVKLFSIGKSVQGRDLWVMRLTTDQDGVRNLPQVKFIANMHGDEIAGRELMLRLIPDLLQNYGKDERIKKIFENLSLDIMPSMNPDGAEKSKRANANGADLNRDFPDFTTKDNINDPAGRQPETQAVMAYQAENQFALSINFHGGAEVVNYMWDTTGDPHPLNDQLIQIALDYAKRAPYILKSKEFKQGITNGFKWYEVNGGMQDWSYYWYNDVHFTVELTKQKWPLYSELDGYYQSNREAIIGFVEGVLK